MVVKVYGARYSTCTQRVLAVLHEVDVQYDLEFVDMTKGEHKSPGFVQFHHPFGVIPAIENDGIRLFESRAICRYLAGKYSQPQHKSLVPLTPAGAASHGLYEQALSVEYSYFDPAMKTLSYELLFKQAMGHGDGDPIKVQSAKESLAKTLDYYESMLVGQSNLSGESFTLVDLFHMPWFHFMPRIGLEDEIARRPNLNKWWANVSIRPARKSVVQTN